MLDTWPSAVTPNAGDGPLLISLLQCWIFSLDNLSVAVNISSGLTRISENFQDSRPVSENEYTTQHAWR